ncbi:hypothetical protein [Cupriavidus necator]
MHYAALRFNKWSDTWTTYENVFGGGIGERFFKIGLRLLSPALLP